MEAMARRSKDQADKARVSVGQFLASVPHRNEAMEVEPAGKGLLLSVPVRRPRWLVPPLSWVLPWSGYRRVELDEPGAEVFNLCDGKRSVEEIIETFAKRHKLSFREGQVAVTQFLRELLKRGIIALVGRS